MEAEELSGGVGVLGVADVTVAAAPGGWDAEGADDGAELPFGDGGVEEGADFAEREPHLLHERSWYGEQGVLPVDDRRRLGYLERPSAFGGVAGAPGGEAAVVGGHVNADAVAAER